MMKKGSPGALVLLLLAGLIMTLSPVASVGASEAENTGLRFSELAKQLNEANAVVERITLDPFLWTETPDGSIPPLCSSLHLTDYIVGRPPYDTSLGVLDGRWQDACTYNGAYRVDRIIAFVVSQSIATFFAVTDSFQVTINNVGEEPHREVTHNKGQQASDVYEKLWKSCQPTSTSHNLQREPVCAMDLTIKDPNLMIMSVNRHQGLLPDGSYDSYTFYLKRIIK